MSVRMGIGPLAICSAFLALCQVAPAQVKVAVVDTQQAVFGTAEIQAADAEMQKKYKPRQDEIQKITTEGNDLVQKYQKGQGTMSEVELSDLQSQIQKRQRDLQRLNDDLNAEVEKDRNEVLSRASQRMQEVIVKLAQERGFDLVMEMASARFYKPTMDITKDATAAYDKAYPATAAAAPAAAKPATSK